MLLAYSSGDKMVVPAKVYCNTASALIEILIDRWLKKHKKWMLDAI